MLEATEELKRDLAQLTGMNMKNVIKTIILGLCAILILGSMEIMVWVNAFPKDPIMEEQMDFIEKRAKMRVEMIRQWQEEERLRLNECQNLAAGCNPYLEGVE